MEKTGEVQKEMIAAMKAKDAERKETLTLLLSALKAKAKDKKEALTDEEENAIILKEIKQAEESLAGAEKAGRADLIDMNQKRLAVLREFAPKQMSEEEIRQVITGVLQQLGIENPTPQDKGNIMKKLMPLVKGKADGGLVNQLVGRLMK
ncbi:GatB/YqeY domain-containing protein [Christensenella intestinihominis]|uniref:GatB/YqeY domain-containing protein n=1 Tax=Christensenella intestinihominis TaxID=1851429 RepID=UPI00082FC499|nr:GatB/YqeY domain-containing protein [Christensenella intestinihominis]